MWKALKKYKRKKIMEIKPILYSVGFLYKIIIKYYYKLLLYRDASSDRE